MLVDEISFEDLFDAPVSSEKGTRIETAGAALARFEAWEFISECSTPGLSDDELNKRIQRFADWVSSPSARKLFLCREVAREV